MLKFKQCQISILNVRISLSCLSNILLKMSRMFEPWFHMDLLIWNKMSGHFHLACRKPLRAASTYAVIDLILHIDKYHYCPATIALRAFVH